MKTKLTEAELDAWRAARRAAESAKTVTEAPQSPLPDLHKAVQATPFENTIAQILGATDAILTGQAITHCPCPPASLSPAQQLMRQALILRGQEMAEQVTTGTSVAEVDLANCPDCTYCERDDGLLAVKAAALFTLGRASNCMATGETEGIEPTLAFRCQHCEGSYTHPAWIADPTPRDEPYAERETSICVICRECSGMSNHGGKGITLFTFSGDVCDAASLTARAISDGEAAEIVAVTDDADMFWLDRATRQRLKGVAK